MAKRMEHRLENTFVHLELIERIGLFNIKGIKLIRDVNCRFKKYKEDSLIYIKYEMILLKLVRLRRNTFNRPGKGFEKASKLLGAEALPLWRIKLLYFQETCPDKVETVFEEVMSSYVEWLVRTKGIETARQKYIELAYQWPALLELHQKMAELEVIQPNICEKAQEGRTTLLH